MVRPRYHRFACGIALVLTAVSLAGCNVATVTPTGTPPGSATEVTRQSGDRTYLGLAEWDRLVRDSRLITPLFVAYTALDQWRPIARASAKRGTTYTVARLDGAIAGEYIPGTSAPGRVVISETILTEPIDVQAATLAHELYHSQSSYQDGPQGGAACLSEELHAMAWDAYAYDTVIRTDRVATMWTAAEDRLVARWQAGQLDEFVLLSAAYQRECLGSVVR
ncbi:MAG: hypothetical protein ACYDAR_21010 [Thermomicrobiales bacterium]